jgi:hypothetical protein
MIRRASNKLQDITGPAQYDLPSTDKTTEEVKQAATLNESDKESAQNGQLTEDQRWARDRTGWAPQFVQPDEKREEAETLLDHRTFLEEKLGDKFFGGKLLSCWLLDFHLTHRNDTLEGVIWRLPRRCPPEGDAAGGHALASARCSPVVNALSSLVLTIDSTQIGITMPPLSSSPVSHPGSLQSSEEG